MERRMFVFCALFLLNFSTLFASSAIPGTVSSGIAGTASYSATPGTHSCTFESSSGTIDLTPLGSQNNIPRFQDYQDPTGQFIYSFNPCFGFDDGATCTGVELCQHEQQGQFNYDLGSDSTATFVQNQTHVYLQYQTTGDLGVVRTSYVVLECDATQEGVFTVEGEGPPTVYHFTLRSKYACPNTVKTTTSPAPPPTGLAPTNTPAPSPGPNIFNLKTITYLLAAILVSLWLLIFMVFVGLITRSSNTSQQPEETNFNMKWKH